MASSTKRRNICLFCEQNSNDLDMYGKRITKAGITVHYFCMLFSSGLCQNGTSESNGVLGFLAEDILKEVKRATPLRCFFCKKKGATIGCVVKTCRKTFHLACGRRNGTLHQFFDTFKSFCLDHRPVQTVTEAEIDPEITHTCSICINKMDTLPSNDTLQAPCCRRAWYHRTCIQQYAMSAGLYFFKCPLCNNKDDFQLEMLTFGIYIPDQDASWETEPHAFEDLLERHNLCDAKHCRCIEGRTYNKEGSKWELQLCELCGSSGSHIGCSFLRVDRDLMCCPSCFGISQSQAPELNSSPKTPKRRQSGRKQMVSQSPSTSKETSPYPGPSKQLVKKRTPETEDRVRKGKKRNFISVCSPPDSSSKRKKVSSPTNAKKTASAHKSSPKQTQKKVAGPFADHGESSEGSGKKPNRLGFPSGKKRASPSKKPGSKGLKKLSIASQENETRESGSKQTKKASSPTDCSKKRSGKHVQSTLTSWLQKSDGKKVKKQSSPRKRSTFIDWRGTQMEIKSAKVVLQRCSTNCERLLRSNIGKANLGFFDSSNARITRNTIQSPEKARKYLLLEPLESESPQNTKNKRKLSKGMQSSSSRERKTRLSLSTYKDIANKSVLEHLTSMEANIMKKEEQNQPANTSQAASEENNDLSVQNMSVLRSVNSKTTNTIMTTTNGSSPSKKGKTARVNNLTGKTSACSPAAAGVVDSVFNGKKISLFYREARTGLKKFIAEVDENLMKANVAKSCSPRKMRRHVSTTKPNSFSKARTCSPDSMTTVCPRSEPKRNTHNGVSKFGGKAKRSLENGFTSAIHHGSISSDDESMLDLDKLNLLHAHQSVSSPFSASPLHKCLERKSESKQLKFDLITSPISSNEMEPSPSESDVSEIFPLFEQNQTVLPAIGTEESGVKSSPVKRTTRQSVGFTREAETPPKSPYTGKNISIVTNTDHVIPLLQSTIDIKQSAETHCATLVNLTPHCITKLTRSQSRASELSDTPSSILSPGREMSIVDFIEESPLEDKTRPGISDHCSNSSDLIMTKYFESNVLDDGKGHSYSKQSIFL